MKMISENDGIEPKLVSVEPRADQRQQGLTVWFTGLSGAGKTTICKSVHAELLTRGYRVEMLDADVVRKQFWPDLGFSRVDRDENIRRIGFLAQLLTRNGIIALLWPPSLPIGLRAMRFATKFVASLKFTLIHPCASAKNAIRRGLYRRARSGDLHGFTGIDDPYEAPLAPEIRCATDQDTVDTCRTRWFLRY